MTKSDDPFAKTEIGKPASSAFAAPESPFVEGQTVFGPFQPHLVPEAIAGRSKPSRTVLEAPAPEALATSEAFEKGFTELGVSGPGQTQPVVWGTGGPAAAGPSGTDPLGPGHTEFGGLGPGFTMAGGMPPPEALALPAPPPASPGPPRGLPAPPPALPSPGVAALAPAFGVAPGWDAAAAEAHRELARADALHADGVLAGKSGHFAHADALLRESLDLRRRFRPPGDILVAHGCVSLGTLYFHGQRPDLAEPLYREAWALHRQGLGDMHPDTATRAVELARVLVLIGRVPEAHGMLRGAYEVYSRAIGPYHPATLEVGAMLRQVGG